MKMQSFFRLIALPAAFLAFSSFAGDPDPDPDIEFAGRLERAFQKLAKRIAPCVVSLRIKVKEGTWIEEIRRQTEHIGPPSDENQGSGVIVDRIGLIITNEHVVRGALSIHAKLSDGRIYEAEVCGADPRSDLAMLKLSGDAVPRDLPFTELADSDQVEVGQYAMAIGNPFGLSNTFTMGVVSARGRSMSDSHYMNDVFYGNLIQTDATINPGNSGGPLFDLRGKLIGINTMIYSKTGTSAGCGFAIPSNHLKKRLPALRTGREVEYGWLGVKPEDLDSRGKPFNIPDGRGVLVDRVFDDTPAHRAGITQGMVILEYDGSRVNNKEELIGAINETPIGQTVKVKVLDSAQLDKDSKGLVKTNEKIISVRIARRHAEVIAESIVRSNIRSRTGESPLNIDEPDLENGAPDQNRSSRATEPDIKKLTRAAPEKEPENRFLWRGMQLRELTAKEGLKRGGRIEVMRVRKGTPADRAGFYEGAVLTELKHSDDAIRKFSTLEEIKRLLEDAKGTVAIYSLQDGYVAIDGK